MNFFKKSLKRIQLDHKILNYNKSTFCGPYPEIVLLCLYKENLNSNRPIDFKKLGILLDKHKPGLKGYFTFYKNHKLPIVNKKKIRKWVSISYDKFLMTSKDYFKQCKGERLKNEEDYFKQYDKQYEKDTTRELCDNYEY